MSREFFAGSAESKIGLVEPKRKMSLFEKGRPKSGGRTRGARNKLSVAFLEAFAADFGQHGAEVIKIVRLEKPHEYLKTAAYLMPKEFEITETRLMGIPDHE